MLGTVRDYIHILKNIRNNSIVTAATIFTLAIILTTASNMATAPVAATTTTTTSNTTTSSSGIKLSPHPIYQERAPPGSVTPINQTHISATHSGNGTLTLPNSTQTINTSSNGTAIVSFATSSAYAKSTIRAPNGETVTATIYEIVQFDNPAAAPLGGGKGFVTVIFHTNSTGMLAPLNGVIAAGIDNIMPNGESDVTLWRWESGIPPLLSTNTTTTMEEPPLMDTTTTNAITTSDSNATAATEEEGGEGEQQQCQLEIMPDGETFELEESVTINVTNGGDEALEFPNSIPGLEIENQDTGEAYPLFSTQVITTLEPGESRTFEFTYEELVNEIGTGTIEASVSNGEECSASTTFTLA